MKLPRNLPGEQLIKALNHLGYRTTRLFNSVGARFIAPWPIHAPKKGRDKSRPHKLSLPVRSPCFAAILADVATHHGVTRDALVAKLFGKS